MSKHKNSAKKKWRRMPALLGIAKHRTSGRTQRSPRLKYLLRLQAEKNIRENPQKCFQGVTELFDIEHKN